MSHLTHFMPFWEWWGDCGISQDCSRSHLKRSSTNQSDVISINV